MLTGGATAERFVALASAGQIVAALRERGHTIHVVDTVHGLIPPEDEARALGNGVGTGLPDVAALWPAAAPWL